MHRLLLLFVFLPVTVLAQSPYPNPAPEGRFTVTLDALNSQETNACLYDVLGRRLFCTPASVPAGSFSVEFTVNAAPGTYLWRVGSRSGKVAVTGRAARTAITFRANSITTGVQTSRDVLPRIDIPPNYAPNVLLVVADDMGWADVGVNGQAWDVPTPNIDRVANEGINITQAYAPSPVCSPSRASLLTARRPSDIAWHNALAPSQDTNALWGVPDWLDENETTMADAFKTAGYRTGIVGKWHLGWNPMYVAPSPGEYGFDYWQIWGVELNGFSIPFWEGVQAEADSVLAFIDSGPEPFFVVWTSGAPHAPQYPLRNQIAPLAHLGPANRTQDFAGSGQVYYTSIAQIDEHLGRLLDHLEAIGQLDNTIVIFTSDNGPETLNPIVRSASHMAAGAAMGPFRGGKRTLYEGGIRAPFFVRFPSKVPAGSVDRTTLFSLMDLWPTLATMTDVPPPSVTDGEDLSGAWMGTPMTREEDLLWEFRGRQLGHSLAISPWRAIRQGKWKLLMNSDESRVELYDLEKDPWEVLDLAAAKPNTVARLSGLLAAWQPPPGHIDPYAGVRMWAWP